MPGSTTPSPRGSAWLTIDSGLSMPVAAAGGGGGGCRVSALGSPSSTERAPAPSPVVPLRCRGGNAGVNIGDAGLLRASSSTAAGCAGDGARMRAASLSNPNRIICLVPSE